MDDYKKEYEEQQGRESPYKLKYNYKVGIFTKDDLIKDESGGADAALFIPITRNDGFSAAFLSIDGNTGCELVPIDMLKIWGLLSYIISEIDGIKDEAKQIALEAHEKLRALALDTCKP